MKILRNRPADNCDSIRPLLSAYIDGRLTDEERAEVERHLPGCAGCTSELAQLRLVVSGLQALPPLPVPRSFALRRDEARVVRAPALGGIIYLRRAAATLAACLVLLLGFNAYTGVALRAVPASAPSQTAFSQPTADTSAQRESSQPAADTGLTAPASAPAGKSAGPEPANSGSTTPGATAALAAPAATAAAGQAPAPAAAAAPAPTTAQAPAVAAAPVAPQPTARADAAVTRETAPAPSSEKATASGAAQAGQPAPTAPPDGAAQSQTAPARPLWTAALVVTLALLLSVVGAFLGAGRRSRG